MEIATRPSRHQAAGFRFGGCALAISVGAFVALTLAACGGGTQESSSSTAASSGVAIPSAFIAKVEDVCVRANQRFAANGNFPFQNFDPLHPDPGLLPKVGAFFEANTPTERALESRLKALGEPTSGASTWNALRALAVASEANAIKQTRAALASDTSTFVETVNEAQRLHGEIGRKAQAAGFTSSSPCGKTF